MRSHALRSLFAVGIALSTAGCPSKDSPSSSGVTAPSAVASTVAGPLANLESSPYTSETWTSQEGAAMAFVHYTPQDVRISAQCRQPTGQLSCDAIRQLRGAPVEVQGSALTGGISAGTRACVALKQQLTSGHDASGTEDGFCRFADGSMVSTGALERYGMRIIQ